MVAAPLAGFALGDERSVPRRRAEPFALKRVRPLSSADAQAPATLDEPSLLSAVAHDLRTPIAALAMSSELLAEDAEQLEPSQVRAMAAGIQRQALWLQGLVENLLCASVLDEGRFEIHPQPIMLGEVLQEVRPVVEPLLAQKGQRLRLTTGRANREVAVDWRRIGQVLVNLITNASKYAGRDTPIDVSCGLRAQAVRVTVADRGPGLPVGSAGQLFEAFVRGAADARSGKEGVGLGLAIVKAIVEAHGGRVGAANRRGGGSSFCFELLLLPDSSPSRQRWTSGDTGARDNKKQGQRG